MVQDAGAAPRTAPDQLLRPAFRISGQIFQPTQPGQGGAQGWLDPKSIHFWRLVLGAAALGYVCGFHITLGRLRVRV
jgi:hypothetical protein